MQTAEAKLIASGAVRCPRSLTRNGTVIVSPGQKTDPTTMIARRIIRRKHFSINLYEALDLPRNAHLRDFILINEGDFVSVSETIARSSDRRPRTLTAKVSGRFLGLSSGNMIFETDEDYLESVSAGFPGTVTEIIPDRGAYVETKGAFIKGVWGNGKIGQGVLLTLDDIQHDGIFDVSALSMAMAGSVVYANTCLDADILAASVRLSPGGLIFGSLPSDLMQVAMDLPFPVIVTDMLGAGRLSDPVYDILGDNIIKCAYLYSAPARGIIPVTAEIIIPEEEYETVSRSLMTDVSVGSQVRILDGFYSGEVGFVTELLPQSESKTKDGEATDDRVRICVDADTEIVLPVSNVEIVRLGKN